MEVRGRDFKQMDYQEMKTITSVQVEEAMKESISKIVEIVKATLEKKRHQKLAFRYYGKKELC